MNALDWTMLGVIGLSVMLAAAQGFFFEVFSLSGTVLGYFLAMWEYPRAAAWFLPYVKAQPYADIAGFLAIFFAIVILAGMIARVARWAMNEVGLRWVDRLLGGAFGLVRGIAIVTVAVMAIAAFSPNSPALARSQLGGYFLLTARTASWAAPSELRAKVRNGALAIRNLNPEATTEKGSKGPIAEATEDSSRQEPETLALSTPALRAYSGKKEADGAHRSRSVDK